MRPRRASSRSPQRSGRRSAALGRDRDRHGGVRGGRSAAHRLGARPGDGGRARSHRRGAVTETEVGDDGAAYGVEVRLDGRASQVEVTSTELRRHRRGADDDGAEDERDRGRLRRRCQWRSQGDSSRAPLLAGALVAAGPGTRLAGRGSRRRRPPSSVRPGWRAPPGAARKRVDLECRRFPTRPTITNPFFPISSLRSATYSAASTAARSRPR